MYSDSQLRTWTILTAAILAVLFSVPRSLADAGKTQYISYAFGHWVPMVYTDEAGRGKGLLSEVAREVFETELGLTLLYSERPWKRAQLEVKNGTSDFLITVATDSRKAYALASQHVFYTLPLYIYTYADHPMMDAIDRIRSAEDIKRLKLKPVTNLGNGWHKDNIDILGIDTHYVKEEENILLFLASRRADIMIDAVVPTNFLVDKLGLNRDIHLTESRFSQVDFHLLMGRKSRYATWMERINRAFERIRRDGRLKAIVARYERAP